MHPSNYLKLVRHKHYKCSDRKTIKKNNLITKFLEKFNSTKDRRIKNMYAKFHGHTMIINDFKIGGRSQGKKNEKEQVLHAKLAIF